MNDSLPVGIANGITDLAQQCNTLLDVEGMPLRVVHERFTVNQLHGEVGSMDAVFHRRAGLVYLRDSRMPELRQYLRLEFEATQHVLRHQVGTNDVRIGTKPTWLTTFTDTGEELVTSDTTLHLFAQTFPAGTITLGGNVGGRSMYSVVIHNRT